MRRPTQTISAKKPAGTGHGNGQSAARHAQPQALETDALPLKQFVWGAGIECSFLPHLGVDQFAWTQHNRFWRDDLRRAKEELGISHLRYAFPWHVLEAQRGRFDFSFSDERMEEFDRLGIELMLDIKHFGTPLWLKQAVGDVEFPEALEDFTTAIVERYRKQVKIWAPLNEPLVCALFSGDFGFWPPHSRKWRGYMPVLSRIAQAASRGIRAIRRAQPDATVLLCDASENYKTRHESLRVETARRNLRRFLCLDLVMGRVNKDHPLYPWVTAYGLNDIDLEWFISNPQRPDIMGLDYYTHSDWQLDMVNGSVRQRRADSPAGLYGIGTAYYNRYGIPMMLTETSIEGQPINREIWLESTVEDTRRLREEGVPMLGYIWWPLVDQLDWDGALTHRIGKIHEVGLYHLQRQPDGTLARIATPLVEQYRQIIAAGEERIGKLEFISYPTETAADQPAPIGVDFPMQPAAASLVELPGPTPDSGSITTELRGLDAAPGLAAEPAAASLIAASEQARQSRSVGRHGIIVFSHLRWGFVWQRPQQFLSRFARKHSILFVEEPYFDLREEDKPHVAMHRVMPNVTVAAPHLPPSMNRHVSLPETLRRLTREAIEQVNEDGGFDLPLLWYYSPMDSAWSLGHFQHRGIVYDSMDELSQFSGAPKALVDNESRLMQHADIVFTGGYELFLKKSQKHPNVHFFGCGVEVEHFAKAHDPSTVIPADIDFINRPIFGWFGVVDERVDYGLIGEVARLKPEWSFAMVGPVVKVDPNLLPHSPNLFWLGGRDYQQLPNYCKAFDVCIMPFALNAATEFINPTKALEYFATGRPVVSTHVKDVVRQYSELVHLARNQSDDFIQACQRALDDRGGDRLKRAAELARSSSWESTVQKMQGLIKEAITKDQRPSMQGVEPLPDTEIAYSYAATQGS